MQLTRQRFLGGSLVLIWVGLLLYLALLDRLPSTLGSSSAVTSFGHFATHGVLSYLLFLNLRLWTLGWTANNHRHFASLGLSIGGSLAVAILIEAIQAYSDSRDATLSDLVYGGAGAVIGAGTALFLMGWGLPIRLLWGGAGFFVFSPLMVTALAVTFWDASDPQIGDHWHSSYRITICGTDAPRFGDTPGGVHTHSDGLIHVHPKDKKEAGSNATLGLFMSNAGGSISKDLLLLPSGEHYANGDKCQNGERGKLALSVNGTEVNPVATYVPKDGDKLAITFEP